MSTSGALIATVPLTASVSPVALMSPRAISAFEIALGNEDVVGDDLDTRRRCRRPRWPRSVLPSITRNLWVDQHVPRSRVAAAGDRGGDGAVPQVDHVLTSSRISPPPAETEVGGDFPAIEQQSVGRGH